MDIIKLIGNGIEAYKADKAAEKAAAESQRQKELSECQELLEILNPINAYFDAISIWQIVDADEKHPKHSKCRFYLKAVRRDREPIHIFPHSYRFSGSPTPVKTVLVNDSESCTGLTIEDFCYRLGRHFAGESMHEAFE